ncbi:MAG TPA: PEP-CTERM sorting domain-containing protein [Steroidobacteraceae bacterium]|nr:PEP-CTERM sorting domain-containing protein [Steroidobacteraceae bacterium]
MRSLFRAIVATVALSAPLYANAIPVTFDLAGAPKSSVAITDFTPGGLLCVITGCGVGVELNPLLGSVNRTLNNPGDSFSFNFFDIDFYGLGGGSGEISAALAFDSPTGAPTIGGDAIGAFFTIGVLTAGTLDWVTNDWLVNLANGTSYVVTLNDLSGITGNSATVTGTIRLRSGPGSVSVPEPATLTMFGLGLLGLGLMRRRQPRA